jgi:hypothetical protein
MYYRELNNPEKDKAEDDHEEEGDLDKLEKKETTV